MGELVVPQQIFEVASFANRQRVRLSEKSPYRYEGDGNTPYARFFDRLAMMQGFDSFYELLDNSVLLNASHGNLTSVLDLGYGTGAFLGAVSHRYADLAQLTGIDSFPKREVSNPAITIITDDLRHTLEHLQPTSQDIVTAANVAVWLPDPADSLLRMTQKLLKPHGVGFVSAFPLSQVFPDRSQMQSFVFHTSQAGWKWLENSSMWPPEDIEYEAGYDVLITPTPAAKEIMEHLEPTNIQSVSANISRIQYSYHA